MQRPYFELQEVKRLAEEDRLVLSGGPKCWGVLGDYLHGETWRYRDFARGVVGALSPEDFRRAQR